MSDLMICLRCQTRDYAKKPISGSFAAEGALWLLALVIFLAFNIWVGMLAALPALAYSIRRYTARESICASCESKELVSIDSPRGRDLLRASRSASS